MRFILNFIFVLFLFLFLGCTNTNIDFSSNNPEIFIANNPIVNNILEENFNIGLNTAYFSYNDSFYFKEEFNFLCEEDFYKMDSYRFILEDNFQNLVLVGYLNIQKEEIICISQINPNIPNEFNYDLNPRNFSDGVEVNLIHDVSKNNSQNNVESSNTTNNNYSDQISISKLDIEDETNDMDSSIRTNQSEEESKSDDNIISPESKMFKYEENTTNINKSISENSEETNLDDKTKSDITPPILNNLSVEVEGRSVFVFYNVSDNLSGIERGATCDVQSSIIGPSRTSSHSDCSVHNPQTGLYISEIALPEFHESGIWTFSYVSITDRAGNRLSLNENDLKIYFEILNEKEADIIPPVLHDLWVEVEGKSVFVFYNVSDNLSGIEKGRTCDVQSRIEGPSKLSGHSDCSVYNPQTGLYVSEIVLPEFHESGIWTFSYVSITDRAGNRLSLNENDLEIYFEIN